MREIDIEREREREKDKKKKLIVKNTVQSSGI